MEGVVNMVEAEVVGVGTCTQLKVFGRGSFNSPPKKFGLLRYQTSYIFV